MATNSAIQDIVNPIIIVGGGLAGLSAAHEAYLRGANVILLDKQSFLSGNSGKATSGINGALTRSQVELSIKDSVNQFYEDTIRSAKDRASPELIKVLTYNSADAVHWLQDSFGLDLSLVSRLGGHSQPRTHRGKDAKFPGMAITYRLLETLENISEEEPSRVMILKRCQVIDLVRCNQDDHKIIGVQFKNLDSKEKQELRGTVVMATGGYAADFTKNSLLRKYRPDIINLPSTNGTHATGDGQKIIMKNHGVGIDMDKVQVHPTGLIDLNDKNAIEGKKMPRFLFLGAEALRGEGGIILNSEGKRFVDELGTRDYVSAEMEKQVRANKAPIRLVLSSSAEKKLGFHIKHYESRNLMKKVSGKELIKEIGCLESVIATEFQKYNRAAKGEIEDEFRKKYFPNTPFEFKLDEDYHVAYITRVLHFTMGGIKIDERTRVLHSDGKPFKGLYACGEVAGGVHGHNRLGGSSLLACVVFGRVAADQASSYILRSLNNSGHVSGAPVRLKQIQLHLDPRVATYLIQINRDNVSDEKLPENTEKAHAKQEDVDSNVQKASHTQSKFQIPDREYTLEEVSKHNKRDDCWCIVKNIVLDLTSFLAQHPGGEQSILNFAGKDATESFAMLHEDSVIPRYAKDYVLGRVEGKTSTLKV